MKFVKYVKCLILALALAFVPIAANAQSLNPTQGTNAIFPAVTATNNTFTSAPIHLGQNPSGNGGSYSVGNIAVSGVGLTTVTFMVLGSSDGGNTYYALNINAANSPTIVSTTATATVSGLWQVNLVGITDVKISTTGTFTATSVTFVLTGAPYGIISRLQGGSGGAVNSVFGRTGTVVATTGDYTCVMVTNCPTTYVSSFNSRTGAVSPASGDYTVSQVTGAAPLASPAFTGTPTAPTQAVSTNNTDVATTAAVTAAIAGFGPGSVTSVSGLSPLFTVSSPTTTPTFALSNAAQNSVFAGPATGGAGAPSYQTAPTISAANMTNFPASLATSGANSNITSLTGLTTPLSVAQGGTGAATVAANTVFGNFTGASAAPGFSASPAFSAASLTNFPTFNQNTTGYAAGLAGGALGSAPYQSAANTTGFVASPTTTGTYVYAWQPIGSAIAPAALNLGTYLASPPAIGGTIAAQINGTIVSASSSFRSGTFQAGGITLPTIYQGGFDAASASTAGMATFRGSANSGSGASGNAVLEPGAQTGGGVQGTAAIAQSFTTASALAATFEAVSMTTTADQVGASALGSNTNVGIAQTVGGTAAQLYVVSHGKTTARFDGTPVIGDVACYPPASTGTAGLLHDNGTTACTLGESAGVVTGQVSGTGSGATATVEIR
jgi:hypothetical protein